LKNLRIGLLVLILFGITFLAYRIYKIETQKSILKEDLVELSDIKYGLFSVDEWRNIVSGIITKKIEEFDLTESNREELKREISALILAKVKEYEKRYYENRSQSVEGFFGNLVADLLGIFQKIEKDIPNITEEILVYIDDPKNKDEIKRVILDKLNEYADSTFSAVDYSKHDAIIARYGLPDREATSSDLKTKILDLKSSSEPFLFIIGVCILLTVLFIGLLKNITKSEFLLFTLISLILLLTGLLLPMINLDARISEMKFTMLGESITFQDQVLYFKSKSILEIVDLMLKQGKWDLILVGILVLAFSVLFPLSKLISSIGYIYSKKLKSSRLIKFLVFKTGKWSMADVMVVAIFMAYIGFEGLISEQLRQLDRLAQSMSVLTTNQTNLQVGFYMFTSFVILSLLVSHRLQYRLKKDFA
jgi:hypothetical protein